MIPWRLVLWFHCRPYRMVVELFLMHGNARIAARLTPLR